MFKQCFLFSMWWTPCLFLGCFVCNDILFLENIFKNKLQMPAQYPRCNGGDGIKMKSCSGDCGKIFYGEGNGMLKARVCWSTKQPKSYFSEMYHGAELQIKNCNENYCNSELTDPESVS